MTTRRLLLSLLALSLITTWRDDARADLLFVTAAGLVQGPFSGWFNPFQTVEDVSVVGYGMVDDLSWNVISPRDAASGLPTGKRMHKPLALRLRRSGATLQFAKALTDNEKLSTVRVKWFEADPSTGLYAPSQDLYLLNANVASFSTYTVREQEGLATYVDVTLVYTAIGIEDVATGRSYEDDWESQVN